MILLLVLFSLPVMLLLIPFYVEIDSKNGIARIRFPWLFSIRLVLVGAEPEVVLKIAWWQKELRLSKRTTHVSSISSKKPTRKLSFDEEKLIRICRTFRVKKFSLVLDTGSMVANGMLYPLFLWISRRTGKKVSIDFNNRSEFTLKLQNSLGRIAWAFITK